MKIEYLNDTKGKVNFHLATNARGDLSPLAPLQMRELKVPDGCDLFLKTWESKNGTTLLIQSVVSVRNKESSQTEIETRETYHDILAKLGVSEIIECHNLLIKYTKIAMNLNNDIVDKKSPIYKHVFSKVEENNHDLGLLWQQLNYEMAKRFVRIFGEHD